MKITDQQLSRFCDMTQNFARKYGLTVSIDTELGMGRTNVRMEDGYKWHAYVVCWNEVTSLTDAGTTIFADAINFFGLNKNTPTVSQFDISNVIFNEPATIVLWTDGTKTVVKCQEGDEYSKEVGLALCFAKKALGNKGNFNNVFKKWIPEEKIEPYTPIDIPELNFDGRSFMDRLKEAWNGL